MRTKLLFLLILFLFLTFSSSLAYPQSQDYDYIIIPGQGARSGILPESTSCIDIRERLDLAAAIYSQQESKPTIILSGYAKKFLPREDNDTEARAMSAYLNPKIGSSSILLEENSHQLIENALYTKPLINFSLKPSILVLAPSCSLKRAELAFTGTYQNITIFSLRDPSSSEQLKETPYLLYTYLIFSLPEEYHLPLARASMQAYDSLDNFTDYFAFNWCLIYQKEICYFD
jgi:hypothetical protein